MEITLDRPAIGKRLKEFAEKNYNSITEFAEEMGMHPSSLHSKYFSGESLPGAPFIAKLIKMGCNIEWLFYGFITEQKKNPEAAKIKNQNQKIIEKIDILLKDLKNINQ